MSSGQEILAKARMHVGESYVFGILVPKDNPNWSGPWDCAEFASWLIYQVEKKLYGCDRDFGDPSTADAFTRFWERDAKQLGQIVSVVEAASTAGAAILRLPVPGGTGHIVISDGTGGTIEAHSRADGVIKGNLDGRRWDLGILVPGVQYAPGASVRLTPPPNVLRLGSAPAEGKQIKQLQSQLASIGFDPGVVDGILGPHTSAAITAFQLSKGLTPDGEVGVTTQRSLGVEIRRRKKQGK